MSTSTDATPEAPVPAHDGAVGDARKRRATTIAESIPQAWRDLVGVPDPLTPADLGLAAEATDRAARIAREAME